MITTRHIGGGHKRRYRIVDFKRNKDDILGTVAAIEYDPNRNANICLINYADGENAKLTYANGKIEYKAAKLVNADGGKTYTWTLGQENS